MKGEKNMGKRFVVTIGREFGSGGRETGMLLAEKLGVRCYDKELLKLSADKCDRHESYLEAVDEKSPGIFSSFGHIASVSGEVVEAPGTKAYLAQFCAIKELAEKENCVIIGRCSDYILSDKDYVLNCFIYADAQRRIDRLMKVRGVSEKEAKTMMAKEDKKRAAYYEFYTDKRWGARQSYDLCINTSKTGTDKAAELIKLAIEELL